MTMLLHLYASYVWPVDPAAPKLNGAAGPRLNGHARGDSQRLRDAEEFELEGLMSDEEGETIGAAAKRKENGTPI